MSNFWVSWYLDPAHGEFELHTPWWVTGEDDAGRLTVCGAIRADSESHARALVLASYDVPPVGLEYRFVQERPADWSPFSDRFKRAPWMQWEEAS